MRTSLHRNKFLAYKPAEVKVGMDYNNHIVDENLVLNTHQEGYYIEYSDTVHIGSPLFRELRLQYPVGPSFVQQVNIQVERKGPVTIL